MIARHQHLMLNKYFQMEATNEWSHQQENQLPFVRIGLVVLFVNWKMLI